MKHRLLKLAESSNVASSLSISGAASFISCPSKRMVASQSLILDFDDSENDIVPAIKRPTLLVSKSMEFVKEEDVKGLEQAFPMDSVMIRHENGRQKMLFSRKTFRNCYFHFLTPLNAQSSTFALKP